MPTTCKVTKNTTAGWARVIQFILYKEMTLKDFCEPLGWNPSSFSTWSHNKSKIRLNFANSCQAVYNLNAQWLMTGEGPHFVNGEPDMPELEKPEEPMLPSMETKIPVHGWVDLLEVGGGEMQFLQAMFVKRFSSEVVQQAMPELKKMLYDKKLPLATMMHLSKHCTAQFIITSNRLVYEAFLRMPNAIVSTMEAAAWNQVVNITQDHLSILTRFANLQPNETPHYTMPEALAQEPEGYQRWKTLVEEVVKERENMTGLLYGPMGRETAKERQLASEAANGLTLLAEHVTFVVTVHLSDLLNKFQLYGTEGNPAELKAVIHSMLEQLKDNANLELLEDFIHDHLAQHYYENE